MAHQVENLVATGTDPTTVTLSWDDAPLLTGPVYDIERNGSIIETAYADPHTVGDPYVDTNSANVEYTYRVRAWGGVEIPAFSPADITGLETWWDFSDISMLWKDTIRTDPVTADGDTILGVTDKSGNLNHLSEATNGPTYKVNIINGLSVARFDGTNDRFVVDPLTSSIAHPYTTFYVGQFIVNEANDEVFDGKVGARGSSFGNTGNLWSSYYGGGGAVTSAVATDTSLHVMQGTANGASSELRIDGGANLISGAPGNQTLTAISLAGNWNAGGGTYTNLDLMHLLFYSGDMSDPDKDTLGNYLATLAGTTWTDVS